MKAFRVLNTFLAGLFFTGLLYAASPCMDTCRESNKRALEDCKRYNKVLDDTNYRVLNRCRDEAAEQFLYCTSHC